MPADFIHLCVHSEYSLSDSTVRIKSLVSRVAEQDMPAVAVCDQSNMFSLVRFYKAAMAAGIKPIMGCDLWIENDTDAKQPWCLRLLVQNQQGYLNLTRLVSRSYQHGQHLGRAVVKKSWLQGASDGLIALSAGVLGDVGAALLSSHKDLAERCLDDWLELFADRFYLELSRTGRAGEDEYIQAAVDLALAKDVALVASNDVRFLHKKDFDAHEVRVCVHAGRTLADTRRPHLYSEEQYLKSTDEMRELFSDLPEALQNTVEIARRCTLDLTLGENFLPDFPVPEGQTIADYLGTLSRKGLDERLQQVFGDDAEKLAEQRPAYEERLQIELDVIINMGFPGYFLIVADFIHWAKQNDVPVGPGRGSGAGSVVAWVLKITDLDPLEHELLFERFLNPERVSMPDFDIDFCMEGRDRVIDYVAQRYGRDAVSQIITYGRMAAKAVVRDVGRVLGHPYGFVDRIAKLIPFDIGMTLDKALEESEELLAAYKQDDEVTQLIDMARKLEGLARNAGKHAGGVVIAPTQLTDFAPLYCEPDGSNLVTQFDKDDVEAVGLVKFDFLGLRTLTIIDWALKTINSTRAEQGESAIDISSIPMQDEHAFKLLKNCQTTAVFQLESRGMKELVKKLQPDCFDEITALVALFRPGPLQSGMVDDFIERKHGRAQIVYPHPDLEPILSPTYGVILYQEQVMQIAQVLAGYSLGGADLLRRAMGKKKAEEMQKQRSIFTEGAVKRGVEEETATYIFDLMEKFAGYGFNKSHSAAYALVSYQTLWIKAYYPAAFMAAVLSADMDNTEKVVMLIDECASLGLQVNPPDVNQSAFKFTVADDATVVYGLGALKGVGESAIEAIVVARKAGSAFSSLLDLYQRVDLKKINKRVIEALIRAGALDALAANRATLMQQLPVCLRIAEQQNALQQAGQDDLFGMAETSSSLDDEQAMPDKVAEWSQEYLLQAEKEVLGLYLSGHPITQYEPELSQLVTCRIGSLENEDASSGRRKKRTPVLLGGLVGSIRQSQTQRGKMASILLDDNSGRIEAVAFSQVWEAVREKVTTGQVLLISGTASYDEYRGSMNLRAEQILDIDEVRNLIAEGIELDISQSELQQQGLSAAEWVKLLQAVLEESSKGSCRITLAFTTESAQARLHMSDRWKVTVNEALLKQLRALPGIEQALVRYRQGGLMSAIQRQAASRTE